MEFHDADHGTGDTDRDIDDTIHDTENETNSTETVEMLASKMDFHPLHVVVHDSELRESTRTDSGFRLC